MQVIVTGTHSSIGLHLHKSPLGAGHEITAAVRTRRRFHLAARTASRFKDCQTTKNIPVSSP